MDAVLRIRANETRPVYGEAVLAGGTLTISGTPTFVLRNNAGATVASGDTTNKTAGAAETVRAWLTLNAETIVTGGLAPGFYTLEIKIVATGSDSISRVFRTIVALEVVAVPSLSGEALQAYTQLRAMAQADHEPTLDDGELLEILARHQTATNWKPSTVYTAGQGVVPTTRNGRVYRCRVPGLSGATEPSWGNDGYIGAQITDGSITWEDNGPGATSLYDLGGAAREAWTLKAGKAARDFYFATSGQQFSRQQVIDNCLKMADRYSPIYVG